MRRLLFIATLLLPLAVAGPAGAATHRSGASSACAGRSPAGLRFTRVGGHTFGTLRWTPGTGSAGRFRVLRNGTVVGQTRRHFIRVNVALGRHYTLQVVTVFAGGGPQACGRATLRIATTYRLPGPPRFPAARTTNTKASISWQRSIPGDAPVVGYRVLRDGAVYGQTRRRSMSIRIASGRAYTFTVIAVDRNDRLSRPSAPVRVRVGHHAPTTPGGLSGSAAGSTSVSLSWSPSYQSQGAIAGYRVLRDGAPIGQYSGTTVTVGNLSPSRTYSYSVVAVDTLGYVSAASSPVSVRTDTPGAPSAPGSLLGAPLNDGTVQLSWQSSQPAQGRIVGYRILRDGTPIGQYSGTTVTIGNLAASTTYTFTVLAVDSLGDLSPATSTVAVTTANPTPTSGHVYAFVLADTDESFADFQNHYQEIGTISPTYYDCNNTTTLSGANVPLITQWAQARQVKVAPRFNCQNGVMLHAMLTNPTLSQQWIDYIVNQVTSNGYDGATVDFEAGYASDRGAYTAFITSLAAALHAAGKTLILCVSAKTADVPNNPRSTFFDYNSLSAQVDEMFVMAWGIHWATSGPGAQDDLTWVNGVVSYISTLPRVNKYILGMQLYAMDWKDGGGNAHPATSYEYQPAMALAAQVGATPIYDSSSDAWTFNYTDGSGNSYSVWYTNAATEGDRIALAHANGFGGVGVWRLGEEDQALWSNPLLTGTW